VKRPVRVTAAADLELNEAADYYDQESAGLGGAFLDAVEHAVVQLAEYPESAVTLRDAVRKQLLVKFPYALLYSVRDDGVRILAVAHQMRRPFYWRGRE
jgi:plasmid stabilization system protein ParE